MQTNGRFEARVLLRLAVLMRSASDPALECLALTENVSSRGARILTKRPRKSGELCELSALAGDVFVSARVVYCERLASRTYCIGFELQDPQQDWWHGKIAFRAAPQERKLSTELHI
jgi:hypothetical protein